MKKTNKKIMIEKYSIWCILFFTSSFLIQNLLGAFSANFDFPNVKTAPGIWNKNYFIILMFLFVPHSLIFILHLEINFNLYLVFPGLLLFYCSSSCRNSRPFFSSTCRSLWNLWFHIQINEYIKQMKHLPPCLDNQIVA